MLPDTLAATIREVGEANGGALLLDAGSGRAILTDARHAFDLCRNLRRAGFTRFVDFTATHSGTRQVVAQPSVAVKDSEAAGQVSGTANPIQAGTPVPPGLTNPEEFTLYLTLRAPEHAHARLTLKWKWTQPATYAPCDTAPRGAGQPGDELQAGPVDQQLEGAGPRARPEPGGAQGRPPSSAIHPSLFTIWPAAAVAEREIFEMLGIAFAGNALEPLLLDEAFVGHPLRREFAVPEQESYVHRLLQQRHAEGLIEALVGATRASPENLSGIAITGDARVAPTVDSTSEASHD